MSEKPDRSNNFKIQCKLSLPGGTIHEFFNDKSIIWGMSIACVGKLGHRSVFPRHFLFKSWNDCKVPSKGIGEGWCIAPKIGDTFSLDHYIDLMYVPRSWGKVWVVLGLICPAPSSWCAINEWWLLARSAENVAFLWAEGNIPQVPHSTHLVAYLQN